MKSFFLVAALCLLTASARAQAPVTVAPDPKIAALQKEPLRDLYSDTWVAVDDLGRKTPMGGEIRGPQMGKTVALFYYIGNSTSQHFDLENSNTSHQTPNKLFDISKILAADPRNPQWGPVQQAHW